MRLTQTLAPDGLLGYLRGSLVLEIALPAFTQPQQCLDFWFSEENQPFWFKKEAAFDGRVRECLEALHCRAAAGELTVWEENAEGNLALILLLDQVPRNLYRGTARAFACDHAALASARQILHRGLDLQLTPDRRMFAYLPFEHSEDLADQFVSVALFGSLPDPDLVLWAEAHRQVIQRFGRFPHRNNALCRPSTPEEKAYLAEPGAGF